MRDEQEDRRYGTTSQSKPEDEVQVSREYENLVKELRKYAGYA